MNAQKTKELIENGTLTDMYKDGYVSDKIFTHFNIYSWVRAQVQTRGISQNKAVGEAEVRFDVCRATVYLILKKFK